MSEPRRVLLVGGGDVAGEVCEALDAGGGDVTWVEHAELIRPGGGRESFPLEIAK